MPKRIQRKRTKGWRLPDNARCVTRPSRWGNPFVVGDPHPATGEPMTAESAVLQFYKYADRRAGQEPGWLAPLRGKDLACYCQPGADCHADVLLYLANQCYCPD